MLDSINIENQKDEILNAIAKVDGMEIKSSFSFGDGKSTNRFFNVISNDKIWNVSLQKQFIENGN